MGSQGFAQLAIELHAGTLAGVVDRAPVLGDDRLILAVTYPAAMPSGGDVQGDGTVFNEVASEYERHRPTYPDALIDQACEVAGVGPGTRAPARL